MATSNLDLESPHVGFSFSDLLNGVGEELPMFKATQPPSLSLSPRPFSPSSFFAFSTGISPTELLSSPVLLAPSQILPSPTTGSFPTQPFIRNSSSNSKQPPPVKEEEKAHSDFSFQPPEVHNSKQESVEIPKSEYQLGLGHERKGSDDGYNWRKYGQKQVKGSENPRSYFKCTFPGCPTKKLVERSLVDGHVTEIVYKGTHNHPKPQVTRRNSSSYSHRLIPPVVSSEASDHSQGNQYSAAATPENSSASFDESREEYGEEERVAKRCKGEVEGGAACVGFGNRTVKEPRVVVQTTSDVDILDDGYRWRKYGQKVVKGNPNPRSYYKCTSVGCPVRKLVERAPHDTRLVITTYEGKHGHDVPAARGGGCVNVTAATRPTPLASDAQNPFAFEMLKAHDGYGFHGYMGDSYAQQQQRDDVFLEAFV